jgi:hypothetical protein
MIHIFTSISRLHISQYAIKSALSVDQVSLWYDSSENTSSELMSAIKSRDIDDSRITYMNIKVLDSYLSADSAKLKYRTTKAGSLAPYVDILRLEILSDFAGFWIDDDAIVFQSIERFADLYSSQFENKPFVIFTDASYHPRNQNNGAYPSNYAMGCNKISTYANELYTDAKQLNADNEKSGIIPHYHAYGPSLLTNKSKAFNDNVFYASPNAFPSILMYNSAKYTESMTVDSWSDIMFIRDMVGMHLTQINRYTVKSDSILGIIFDAINRNIDPISQLFAQYQSAFYNELMLVMQYQSTAERNSEDYSISLHNTLIDTNTIKA